MFISVYILWVKVHVYNTQHVPLPALVECLPLAAQFRFPPSAVGIFLHPVTLGPVWICDIGSQHLNGFYSDVVKCLPLDAVAQCRFPLWAVGIFLQPVTFGGQYAGP